MSNQATDSMELDMECKFTCGHGIGYKVVEDGLQQFDLEHPDEAETVWRDGEPGFDYPASCPHCDAPFSGMSMKSASDRPSHAQYELIEKIIVALFEACRGAT